MLPVIGYNSGQYDLGCFAELWPYIFGFVNDVDDNCDENDVEEFVEVVNEEGIVEKKRDKTRHTHRCKVDKVNFKPNIIGHSKVYKQIVTKHGLKFLDLINYVPAKTSLDGMVRSYKLPDVKGFFPYATLGREDFAQLIMKLDWSTYNLFEDNLTLPPYRVQGHLLEKEWQGYAAEIFRNTTQPIVYCLAELFCQKKHG